MSIIFRVNNLENCLFPPNIQICITSFLILHTRYQDNVFAVGKFKYAI